MGIKREELRKIVIEPKSKNQSDYLDSIDNNYITFGIGPAGCGKTFLAVLKAMQAFQEGKVRSILLARPAKEAGEKLGFLPGGIEEKLDPYMLPLYDAMNEHWADTTIQDMMDKGLIEICPVGFMRGRTFRNAFIIVDEAQNMTREQLKMVLTRFGSDSKMVVNGDHRQSDLTPLQRGSLKVANEICREGVDGVNLVHLNAKEDIQRHQVVADISEVWDRLYGEEDDFEMPKREVIRRR